MNLRDVPVVGQIISALSLLLDLILNSGEFVIMLIWVLAENIEIVLSIVLTVNRLAENTPLLPDDIVQQVSIALFAAMLIVYLGRLLSNIGDKDEDS